MFFLRAAILILLGGLGGCETFSVSRHQRDEISSVLAAYKQALNSKSYASLKPLLAKPVSVDGLPDELSRAAVQSGSLWPPAKIDELRILSIKPSHAGFETKIWLHCAVATLKLNVGFDPDCKIRSIAGDPVGVSHETKPSRPFTTTFTTNRGLPYVKATLNGRTGYFLLDTGSSGLVLNKKYFKSSPKSDTPGFSATVNGIAHPDKSLPVGSLEWGNLHAKNLVGDLDDFSAQERPEITPLLGAISNEELRNLSIIFDWKQRTIEVLPTKSDGTRKLPAGETPPAITVPFTYFGHVPLVKVQIGSKTYNLLFDSGAQSDMLPDADGLDGHFHQSGFLSGLSTGGAPESVHVPLGTIDRLLLGEAEFLSLPFVIYRVPHFQGNGIIGTPLIQQRRVEINFRARQISLWK